MEQVGNAQYSGITEHTESLVYIQINILPLLSILTSWCMLRLCRENGFQFDIVFSHETVRAYRVMFHRNGGGVLILLVFGISTNEDMSFELTILLLMVYPP